MAFIQPFLTIRLVGHRQFRYSIRNLLVLFVIVSVSIATVQFTWSRRSVSTLVPLSQMDVSLYEPYIDDIAKESDAIAVLQIDRRNNAMIVTAQARNIDTAKRDVERLVSDPSSVYAAASLGVTLGEARNSFDDL